MSFQPAYVIIILGLLTPLHCHAQWEQTNGPWTGGYTTAICTHNTTLLAGTHSGVYRSTNDGAEWNETSSDADMGTVVRITPHGASLFALGHTDRLFKSTDDGKRWLQVDVDTGRMFYSGIASNQARGILLVSAKAGIYKSIDNGFTWMKSTDTLVQGGVSMVAYSPDGDFAIGRISNYFIQSTDNGETWRKVGSKNDVSAEDLVYNDSVLFAVGYRGIHRSFDDGASWEKCTTGLPESNGYTLLSSHGTVYAGYPDGVYASHDQGATWSNVSAGLPVPMFRVFSLAANDDGSRVVAATDFGVWTTAYDVIYWSPINEQLPTLLIVSMASNGREVFAGSHGRGIYVSSDDGDSWQHFADSILFRSPNYLVSAGDVLISDFAWHGVRRWTYSSGQWNQDTVKLPVTSIRNAVTYTHATGDKTICTANDYNIWISADNGTTWEHSFRDTSGSIIYSVAAQQLTDGSTILYAGTLYNGILISYDEGRSWDELVTFPESYVGSIVASTSTVFAATGNGLLKSGDRGQNWEAVTVGLPGERVDKLWKFTDGLQATHLFAFVEYNGVYYSGIYYSGDEGNNWYHISSGLPPRIMGTVSSANGYLFAGTSHKGVWRRKLEDIIALPAGNPPTPAAFVLHQNYPNPVSSSYGSKITQIDYELANSGSVTLSVCNVLGTSRVYVEEGMKSSGKHTTHFDTSGLPPGVYLYRLVAGNRSLERKMLIIP